MTTLAIALALAVSAGESQSETAIPPQVPALPLDQVRDADPVALAGRALPPEVASKVVGGLVRRQWMPGQAYFIRLDERAKVYSPDLCRRLSYFGGASAAVVQDAQTAQNDTPLELKAFTPVISYVPTYPKVADDATCQTVTGWMSVSLNQTEPTLRMLARLTEAMQQAAGRERLPFDLSCTTETSYSTSPPCRNARHELAVLPLGSLLSIRLQNTVYRDEPARNGVQTRWMQPVENDRWPQAEVSFDAFGEGGRSWTVILKGVDRLEAVEMRRATIIRH